MAHIKHLSITVNDPRRAATVLAEITGGVVERFSSGEMTDAWTCIWNINDGSLVEFIPAGFIIEPSNNGAQFNPTIISHGYNATHVQIETTASLTHIINTAEKYGCTHFFRKSKSRGGPLYEVWIEKQCLIEFTSSEILLK